MSKQPVQNIRGTTRWLGLTVCLMVCFSAASMGALFLPGAWYAGLNKPSWNPPGWVFGPVWSALYTMMAVAAWLVWQRGGFVAQRWALTWFIIQLALNAAWTPLFFGLHLPSVAFGEMLLLWAAIVATLRAFFQVNGLAGWLLAPYLAWVSCAAVLNFTIWRLNP